MKTNIQQTVRKGLVAISLVLVCTCCASVKTKPSEEKGQPPGKSDYFVHKIRWPGETLSIIAIWYTGNYRNWIALAKANPNLNPNRIFRGNRILIPSNLLKTRKELPKEFVAKFTSKPKRKVAIAKPTPAPPPEEEKEPELFGPRGFSAR